MLNHKTKLEKRMTKIPELQNILDYTFFIEDFVNMYRETHFRTRLFIKF